MAEWQAMMHSCKFHHILSSYDSFKFLRKVVPRNLLTIRNLPSFKMVENSQSLCIKTGKRWELVARLCLNIKKRVYQTSFYYYSP